MVGIHRKAECLANGIQKMSQTILLLCSSEKNKTIAKWFSQYN